MTPAPLLADEITADWLGEVLSGTVTDLSITPVGTGQIGACVRAAYNLDGEPGTVLVKLPAADPASRELMAGAYRIEARFYDQLAGRLAIRVPECFLAEPSDSGAVLVLEDLAPRVQGDQIAGCTPGQVLDAAVNLAGLHAPRWNDPTLHEIEGLSINDEAQATMLAELYGPTIELFLTGLGSLVSAEDGATLRAGEPLIKDWSLARQDQRFGLVHGDYRLDNLLFPPDGGPGVVAVDFQTLSLGLPVRDLSYLVATSLEPADRAAHEHEIVAAYYARLVELGSEALAGYTAEMAFEDYRFGMLQVPLVVVFGCAYGARTERGDRMFAAMIRRGCAAIRELGTHELI